ncbi:MAG TPA: cytochrome c peroxidase [Burkholderiaceae bacterium]|nr:cytochrome c peroxidase [Burkholderiaceae bacterium]
MVGLAWPTTGLPRDFCATTRDALHRAACRSVWTEEVKPPKPSAAYELGQILFFDPRLSGDNSTSCASCHHPALGWSDGTATPARFPKVKRRTQSLWDVGRQKELFWDGRASSLEQQAVSPLESPDEMNSSRLKVARIVSRDPDTRRLLEQVRGASALARLDDIFIRAGYQISGPGQDPGSRWRASYEALSDDDKRPVDEVFTVTVGALAAFQRGIVSGPAVFDTVAARPWKTTPGTSDDPAGLAQGMSLFFGRANCARCHTGVLFSDQKFHSGARLTADAGLASALAADFPAHESTLAPRSGCPGSRAVASRAAAKREIESGRAGISDFHGYFRTPTLRNVATHPPYFHDGRALTLRDAVLEELGRSGKCEHGDASVAWSRENVDALVVFLESLTSTDAPKSGRAAPADFPPHREK